MARKPHKYHYIYKITCNVNGKYYIGMHSCSNLEDGYMGSGKRLRRSLNKHGIGNHTKEILEFLDDRESLRKREAEIINEELIQDPLCMNLQLGGGGGYISKENQFNRSSSGGKSFAKSLRQDANLLEKVKINASMQLKKLHTEGKINYNTFTGKKHSEESKRKMSESSKGKGTKEKNSQFGTRWITDGIENKKIKKDEQIPDGWKLGRKI
jgi:hypothetical protein